MARRFLLVAVALAAACKGGDSGWKPPETICAPSTVRCFGNYLGTCDVTGKRWDLVFCGVNQYCEAASKRCAPIACTPGSGGCEDGSPWRCLPDGSARERPGPCKEGQQCFDGECLDVPCGAGETRCIFETLWTCTGGDWVPTKCGKDQGCLNDACAPRQCVPRSAACGNDRVAGTCNATGTDWEKTICGEHQVCVDGFCFEQVANPPSKPEPSPDVPAPADVAGDRAPSDQPAAEPREDLPQVEAVTPGENKATINGVEVRFLDLHDADWVSSGQEGQKTLMITLISRKVDVPGTLPDVKHTVVIRVSGIAEGQVGTFHCEDVSSYTTAVWYSYGKYPQGETCKDFDYEAASCTVTIEEFGPDDGGHVRGTFTDVDLVDCQQDGTTHKITDGVFDATR